MVKGDTKFVTIKDQITGKDLYLPRSLAQEAFKRAGREKQKVAQAFKRLTFSEMQGVSQRSLFELQSVLRYERGLRGKKRR
jgi:hypothetical protein